MASASGPDPFQAVCEEFIRLYGSRFYAYLKKRLGAREDLQAATRPSDLVQEAYRLCLERARRSGTPLPATAEELADRLFRDGRNAVRTAEKKGRMQKRRPAGGVGPDGGEGASAPDLDVGRKPDAVGGKVRPSAAEPLPPQPTEMDGRRSTVGELLGDTTVDPADQARLKEAWERVNRSLDADERELFRLLRENLPVSEIAVLLDISLATAYRSVDALKKKVDGALNEQL